MSHDSFTSTSIMMMYHSVHSIITSSKASSSKSLFRKQKQSILYRTHHIGPALVREFQRKETPTSLILQQVAYCAPVNYCQFHKFNLEYRDIIYQFFMPLCHIRNNKELLVTFTLYSVHLLPQGFLHLIEKQEEKPRNNLKL